MDSRDQPRRRLEVACQQVLLTDASVYSIQWTDINSAAADGMTAQLLLDRYLAHIRRWTFGLVRPTESADGIAFRFWCTGFPLLTFNRPSTGNSESVIITINGGFLVQREQCHRGELAFRCTSLAAGKRLALELSDYCPLLLGSLQPSLVRKWLYRFTQAFIHRGVTIYFLQRVYHELTGEKAAVSVVTVNVKEGEPT